MPSVPISFREAKEPVDRRRPYLKPSIKEEGTKEKVKKCKSRKVRKSQCEKKVRQEKSGKSSPQDMVSGQMGTQNYQNTFQKEISSQKRDF